MLKVSDLCFEYGNKTILSGLSFEAQPEMIIALLGPNGSGKTTLLRCLDLYLRPRKGSILFNGSSLAALTPGVLARRIAYMPQRCGIAGLTVFDSVLLGRKPYFSWSPSDRDLALTESTLRRLDLWNKAHLPLDRLSGGELQKAALARTFVQEPDLLLLDEPTSALDLKNKSEIMTLLRDFVREKKAAVLMSIHDLNEALRYADRLLFLRDGKIMADETPRTLSENVLNRVYDISLELHTVAEKKLVMPRGVL